MKLRHKLAHILGLNETTFESERTSLSTVAIKEVCQDCSEVMFSIEVGV